MMFHRYQIGGVARRYVYLALALAGLVMEPGKPMAAQANPGALPVFHIAAIANPDQSRWAVELIKEQRLDRKYGFTLDFTLKPVSVAYTDFVNGSDPVCMCLTIATGARFLLQGVDVALVWTYNAYKHAYLVTEQPDIQRPQDVVGHSLAGSTGSGSWIFQQYFLQRQQHVDLSKVDIPSIVASAQSTYLLAKRVDAITVFDPTRIQLEQLAPGRFRYIPIFDTKQWQAETGIDYLPMFLLGLRRSWYQQPGNQELLKKFHAAYREAIDFMVKNPEETAKLLGEDRLQASPDFAISYLKNYPETADMTYVRDYRQAVKQLTQELLPPSGLIDRPLTDKEVDQLILDFRP
ncbi:ABC transporter substrate-binding protein [Sodalis sp. RH21]|uniref:ABC transporter substrate-binding protein n=1 Tax=unclassified Sodalis (in: enterobacteria) TaxID=2636512 RepID=UPI0039B3E607